jgi:hypothetical protein
MKPRIEALKEILQGLKNGEPFIIIGLKDKQVNQMVALHSKRLGTDYGGRYYSSIRHLGWGFFEAKTPNGTFSFDGGGAMLRAGDVEKKTFISWSPLRIENKFVLDDLDYPFDEVIAAIEKELSEI